MDISFDISSSFQISRTYSGCSLNHVRHVLRHPNKNILREEFPAWHDKYGPIIRIEPDHLHIRDIDAFNQVHKMGSRFDKEPALYSFPFSKGSIFNTWSNKVARGHRDMYAPYFSRTAIVNLQSVIKENLGKFLKRMDAMAADSRTIDLTRGFKCLTGDTILRYIFNQSFNALDSPGFIHPLIDPVEDFISDWTFTAAWYFPKLMGVIAAVCIKWPRIGKLNKSFKCALEQVEFCGQRVVEFREREKDQRAHIFYAPLNPNPKKGHPTLNEITLARDGWILFFAGTDTSAGTLAFGTWHLLNNPHHLRMLQEELKKAIPKSDDLSTIEQGWVELEKLDFLRAVVKESLRLFYGIPGKNPRVVPPEGTTLCGQFIPGGTVISMSAYTYQHNPAYFSTHPHHEFRPERWLKKEDAEWNEKFLFPFGRGARNCLGQNLALATLYMTFAYIFRRFELELFETTKEDMDWHDGLLPMTFGHLKVKAKRMQE